MGLTNIYSIAKSILPFIKGDGVITPEGIYKIIMTNKNLEFIFDIISLNDIPVLIFTSYEILKGNDNPKIVGKIKNNLFAFNIFEFGDKDNDVECDECSGSGEISCDYCDGNGYKNCDECGGGGEVQCPDCDGTGLEADEELNCNNCNGNGEVTCDECSGDGSINCDECTGGYISCSECDGSGTNTVFDKVPYEILVYISYDIQLKDKIESSMLRNEQIKTDLLNDKCLNIIVNEYPVNDSSTELVNLSLENKTYFGETVEIDNQMITKRRNNLYIDELDFVPEKFEL